MNGRPFLTEEQKAAERAEAALEELARRQLREDVRAALADERVRRVVWMFIQCMGVDDSPFSNNGPAQSRLIGRMEAGQWWLKIMRENCPEREAQMRAEANRQEKQLQQQLRDNQEKVDDR